jgi:large subunit ribosomal protein L23
MSILDRIRGKKSAQGGPASDGEKMSGNEKPKIVEREKKAKKVPEKIKEEKKLKKKEPTKKAKAIRKEAHAAYKNILSTLVTEKSTILAQYNKYLFKVNLKANKHEIKDAIEGYYGVNVTKVNIIKIHPKVRLQGRTVGFKKGYKKAIVTLKAGDTIGVAEGV